MPEAATAPPIDVGSPIEDPIPLKLRLDGLVIGEVILKLGADIDFKDRFGPAPEVKNCGVDIPTLTLEAACDAILEGLGKEGAFKSENPLIYYPPKNTLLLIKELSCERNAVRLIWEAYKD